MKTDMRIFDLFNARKRVVDRREMDYSNNKGERVKDLERDVERRSILGDRKKSDFESNSFRETYDDITKAEDEKQNNRGKIKDFSEKEDCNKKRVENQENLKETKKENFIASESVERNINDKPENYQQNLDTATKIIRDSIIVVSDKLGLDIGIPENILKEFSSNNLTEDVLEQFSEIMFALKGISQLLGKAAQENVALDIKGVIVEPHEAAALEQILRVEMFRLEVAFKSLGVAGDITRTVAEKMQKPAMDGGIPKAQEPAYLSMPQNQLEKFLGTLLKTEEEKIKAVVAQMSQLAKEQKPVAHTGALSELQKFKSNPPVDGADAKKVADTASKKLQRINPAVVSVDITKSIGEKPVETVKNREFWTFDPQVLRQLLKIDESKQNLTVEAKTDVNIQKTSFLSFSSGSSFSSNQNFQQMLNSSQDILDQVSQAEASPKGEGQAVNFAQKFQIATPLKNIEELVMQQVSRRLATAVKNGVHEVRLVMKPESLGDVRMTIHMEGDIVTARINVENQQVKQIIESNLQSLKDSLEEQNLQAGAFDVNVEHGFQSEENDPAESSNADLLARNASDISDENSEWDMTIGTETGRRFGSNTIEYFA